MNKEFFQTWIINPHLPHSDDPLETVTTLAVDGMEIVAILEMCKALKNGAPLDAAIMACCGAFFYCLNLLTKN